MIYYGKGVTWPKIIMGLIQNVAVIALFSGAYMSNPDEESFKRFLEMEYRKYFQNVLYICIDII